MKPKRKLIGKDELCRTVLDAMPLPVFVLDEDLSIIDFNASASKVLGENSAFLLKSRAGEAMHCANAEGNPKACGHSAECKNCILRHCVKLSLTKKKLVRQKMEMSLVVDSKARQTHLYITTSPFDYAGQSLALLVLEDVTELLALRKLLPVCGGCKRVRDDQDYWHRVDDYMKANLQVDLAHSLCPDCLKAKQSMTPVLSGQRRSRFAD